MELLETTALSHELEKIVTGSNKFLIIVSPYLQVSKRLKPKLEECFNRNERTIILYRENRLASFEMDWFDKFQNVVSLPVKDLHAKCYLNENHCLITSMNWYEHSQINNHEMGVLFNTHNNPKEVNQIINMINTILRTDYHDKNIRDYTEFKNELTMGQLYEELIAEHQFPEMADGLNGVYKQMSETALKLHSFKETDYKKDGKTLLRSAILPTKVYEEVINYIIENLALKPEPIEEEYNYEQFVIEWHRFLSATYPEVEFKIENKAITARDFPCKNIDYSNQYGFASFVFNLDYEYMKKVRQLADFDILTNLKAYRLYWNPSYKMNLYHAKNIKFKNVHEDVNYCASALNRLIPEIKRFADN